MIKTKMVMASILAVAVFSIAAAPLAQDAFAASNSPTHGSEAGNNFDNSGGAIWGANSAAFGQAGIMGSHSSSQSGFAADPGRDGLGNLAQFTGGWCSFVNFLNMFSGNLILC